MKKIALIASMLVAGAASANAAVVLDGSTGLAQLAPDFIASKIIDFEDVLPPLPNPGISAGGSFVSGGFTFTGQGSVVKGSVSGQYASPAGDTTQYLTTGFDGTGGTKTETLVLGATYSHFGLYWGSIDQYNTLKFYNGTTLVGSFGGSAINPPANGDQSSSATNRYVNFSGDFNKVVFQTGQPAFEVDNLALGGLVSTPPVPEISTWAMLLAGFAGVGFVAYRRKAAATRFAFS